MQNVAAWPFDGLIVNGSNPVNGYKTVRLSHRPDNKICAVLCPVHPKGTSLIAALPVGTEQATQARATHKSKFSTLHGPNY